ncbi:MAG: hypothetical protein K2X93_18200 [Candidatus Obscuribacterales bacterium]|nr:hypothetical protein [Candidatus Obscuribacterales bacterium]
MAPTQTKEKQIVLKAIDSLGRRVTPADVATKTGLAILPVTMTLNEIASETQGHMEVSKQGDIAYSFAPGFQSHYLAQGIKRVLERIWANVFSVGFFILRISFGIMLILSTIIILVLLFLLIMYYSQSGRDDDDDRYDGGGFRGGFFPHLSLFDYLILRDILFGYPQYDRQGYRYDRPTVRTTQKSNFFFNCFSFLFGDGNPNLNLEERKWVMIAEVIQRNKGVVTAEQLAPYTGGLPGNEDSVLPVLVRFDGRPEVTEGGDIIYLFPSMQITAHESKLSTLPTYLSEWTWKFSNVPSGQLIWVYVLAGFNLIGSWFLLGQLGVFARAGSELVGLAPLIFALVIYATLFLGVPLVRWVVITVLNQRIESRNNIRLSNARLLENPSPEIRKKLASARSTHVDKRILRENEAIFTTEKDSLEQEFDD